MRTPIAGSYQCGYADFTLSGNGGGGRFRGAGDFWAEHYTYQLLAGDTLEDIVAGDHGRHQRTIVRRC